MEDFREFEGRDLDDSIRHACEYFNAPREKLEIEIIQDAKSGIFGIVLARKAKIRARRATLADAMQDILKQTEAKAEARDVPPLDIVREKMEKNQPRPASKKPRQPRKPRQSASRPPVMESGEVEADLDGRDEDVLDAIDSSQPLLKPEELDKEALERKTVEIVRKLVRPLAGKDVEVSATVDYGSVHARVAWQGDAGLLIGREGQTLAALQYLVSRMLSHAFNAPLRAQLDIGEYRTRQDEKLRALAFSLAEKARQAGRAFSTRPLSSYHRRIIHMTLQDQTDLLTRSSGDGPLKRVIIAVRKNAEK